MQKWDTLLVRTFEDFPVSYDRTVRNFMGDFTEFVHLENAIDRALIENEGLKHSLFQDQVQYHVDVIDSTT